MKKIIRKTLLGIITILLILTSCDMFMSETQSNKKEFTSFNVQDFGADGVAQIISPTITATLPSDADLTTLVIYFTTSPGSSVTVYGRPQVSGRTVNNFTRTVEYMITAENGSTFTYYVDITKEKQEQSDFSLGSNIEKGVNAANFTQIATGVNGTGTTTYSSSDISIATVNSSTGEVNIIAVGETTITATNTGDDDYTEATASYIITVNNKTDQAPLTFTDVTATGISTDTSNEFVTHTATGGSGDGAITYISTKTDIATVVSTTGKVTIIAPGTTTITATKAGDTTYNSTSVSYALTITEPSGKEEQSAFTIGDYLGGTLDKNVDATNFAIVATGSAGIGITTYSSSNTSVATVESLTGEVDILGVGTVKITAYNPGDNGYKEAEASYIITVTDKQDQAALTFTNIIDGSVSINVNSEDFIYEAIGGSGSGALTYISTKTDIATVNPTTGEVTIIIPGTTIIAATKAGDDNYNATSNSYTLTITETVVTKIDQPNFNIGADKSININADNFTQPIAEALGNGVTVYSSSAPSVATVNSSTGEVDILTIGTAVIKAENPGDSTYNPATDSYTITVTNLLDQTALSIGNVEQKTYGDVAFNLTITGGTTDKALTYSAIGKDGTINPITIDPISGTITIIHGGTAEITVTMPGDDDYNDVSTIYELVVNKAEQASLSVNNPSVTGNYGNASFDVEIPPTTGTGSGSGTGAITYSVINESPDSGLTDVITLTTDDPVKVSMVGVGTADIKVTKAGDDNYLPTYTTYSVHIYRGVQTVTLDTTSIDDKEVGDTFQIIAEGTTGEHVGILSYLSANTDQATVDQNGNVEIVSVDAGSVTISVKQPMTNYYNVSEVKIFTINIIASQPSTDFITTWVTDNDNESITIPTSGSETYNYSVDWGDENTDSGVTGNITHTYATAGTHYVKISGTFPHIYFTNTAIDQSKIHSVENWGNIHWTSFDSAFDQCVNLVINATDAPDLSGVTYMGQAFRHTNLTDEDFTGWDVSTITVLNYTFKDIPNFNGDLSNWNVSNVTSMLATFAGSPKFNGDLSNWNVSNVTYMKWMFSGCQEFNQNISSWDVSKVTSMEEMFYNNYVFNADIGNWNVSTVTSMEGMFRGAKDFNKDISSWDVSSVTNMTSMFHQALDFNNGDTTNVHSKPLTWTITNVETTNHMFSNAVSFNQSISSFDVSKVTDMAYMFNYASIFNNGEAYLAWGNKTSLVESMAYMFYHAVDFNQDISSWDISKVTTLEQMFQGATSFNNGDSTDAHNKPLSWTGNTTTGANITLYKMFDTATSFNQDISDWNISEVTNMNRMFYRADKFNNGGVALDWGDKTSNVTEMIGTFWKATVFNQDINHWNVSSVTSMDYMFSEAGAFNQDIRNWKRVTGEGYDASDLLAVKNMDHMFWNNNGATTMTFDQDISSWITYGCSHSLFGSLSSAKQPIWNN